MVIAPCTANVIAKLAHGRADDMLTTTALATEAPLVIAPAMNTHMWRKDVTQRNVAASWRAASCSWSPARRARVRRRGRGAPRIRRDHPGGDRGRARSLARPGGEACLVTAGATREPIDPVRFIGNHSSGRTGFAIAEEAARRGARVFLVTGPSQLPDPFGCEVVRVETALQMRDAVARACGCGRRDRDVGGRGRLPAGAAAADKIKKTDAPAAIELERNPDILAELGARGGGPCSWASRPRRPTLRPTRRQARREGLRPRRGERRERAGARLWH